MGSWKWKFCKLDTVHTWVVDIIGNGRRLCVCGGGVCTHLCKGVLSSLVCGSKRSMSGVLPYHFPPCSLERGSLLESRAKLAASGHRDLPVSAHPSTSTALG